MTVRQNIFGLSSKRGNCQRRKEHRKFSVEPMETRAMMTTLTVDVNDVGCDDPGDDLYCQIHEAVDVTSDSDTINVHAGTYEHVVVDENNLTVQEATDGSVTVLR